MLARFARPAAGPRVVVDETFGEWSYLRPKNPRGRSAGDNRTKGAPLMSFLAIVGTAFAITFLAELPDKSMFASLVLGTRYRAAWVWVGAAAAFTVHMAIAVTAGRALTLLPHPLVEGIVAALFAGGAVWLWWTSFQSDEHEGADAARMGARRPTFLRVAGTAFAVVFLAEWGDITQITAANLAARFDPLLVFVGATLGLWAVAGVAVTVGAKSLDLIPMAWVRRTTGTILFGFALYTAIAAIG